MECFEKNKACLQQKYKLLLEYLQQEENPAGDGLQRELPEDGISFGVSEVEGKQVLYAVKQEAGAEQLVQLDSLYDSNVLTELWAGGQKKIGSYQMKYLFCGFGNGMYIKEILKHADATARILVYEPSARLLSFVLHSFDVSELLADERVTVIAGQYFERSFEDELYRMVTYSDLENLVYQAYPNYERLFPAQVKETDHIIQVMYSSIRATQNVLDRYGVYYTRNGLRNIRHFFNGKSVNDFYLKMEKDIPVIIVASGPSLDKNIDVLKEAKGKCLLVGLDSSLKALIKHNVIPDIFVSVDAKKHINHFKDERIDNIPIICELSSNSQVLDKIKAHKFFINDMNPYINHFFSKRELLFPVFTTGGSVANTASAIFSSMGFQTIIMAGQDLAYTDNRTHSASTLRGEWNLDAGELDGIIVEGYYGGKVKTSYEFQLYLKWFEEEIIKNPDVKFINATEGGAMIHGAENMPLQEVVDQYCVKEINIGQKLDGINEFLTPQLKKEFAEYILQIVPKLRELRHIAEKAARNYSKMKEMVYRDQYRSKAWRKMFEEAKQLGNRLETEDAMFYVQNLIQNETTQIMEHVNEIKTDEREEIITACDMGETYLRKIMDGIDRACDIDWMKEAREAAEKVME